MDSMQEIGEILVQIFLHNKTRMKLAEFVGVVENKKSDVFTNLMFSLPKKDFSGEI